MGSWSAGELLQVPVRLNGIRLGQPVDLLLDTAARRALGFVVLCGDDSLRFLPFAAAQPGEEEIAVGSALMLLEDVDFYRANGSSLRTLLGGAVLRDGGAAGALRDVSLLPDGTVGEVAVARDGRVERLPAAGATLLPKRASAA